MVRPRQSEAEQLCGCKQDKLNSLIIDFVATTTPCRIFSSHHQSSECSEIGAVARRAVFVSLADRQEQVVLLLLPVVVVVHPSVRK